MSEQPPITPDPADRQSSRPIHRIIFETIVVFLIGCTVLGIAWELGHFDIGWILAIIIWVAGDPLLEIIRLIQLRR